jgi:hypothetical protein
MKETAAAIAEQGAEPDSTPINPSVISGEDIRTFLELKSATLALRDEAIEYKRAQERYQMALAAFNRHVAPSA